MKKIIKKNQKKRTLSVLGAAIICLLAGLWMIQPDCAFAAQTDEETVVIGYYENDERSDYHEIIKQNNLDKISKKMGNPIFFVSV